MQGHYSQEDLTNLPQMDAWERSEDSDVTSPAQTSEDEGNGNSIRAPIPLGETSITEQEFLACQLAIKISTNMSDAGFTKQINFMLNSMKEKKFSKLPQTRAKVREDLERIMQKIPVTHVVFCPTCNFICDESTKRPTDANCPKCKINLKKEVMNGRAMFMTLSIKKQIKGYLKQKKFCSLLRRFSKMKHKHMNGKMHRRLIKAGHFDLSLGIDAAQLHRKQGKSFLPAVLFFNNLPATWQLKFPILAALWTGGTKHKPPRSVFLKPMLAELRTLGTCQTIRWKEDTGRYVKSKVFLTTVISDAPEKAELLNQKGSGTYACPYCYIVGQTLTAEENERVFDPENAFRKTQGTTKVGGTRYPSFRRYKWRDSKKRMELGRKVARRRVSKSDPKYELKGIKGLPVVRNLPLFQETDGHVSDSLHLIAEGVFKDIMNTMMYGTQGYGHTFLANAESGWTVFNEIIGSMSQVSEADRTCKPLDQYTEWKALDHFQFLMHFVAAVCSDDSLIKNTMVYKCLIHLSNILFLSYGDNVQEDTIDKVEEEVRNFFDIFKQTFTEEYFTYKVHVLKHVPDFLRLHGSAIYTDAFNLERFLGQTKRLLTTTRLEMKQLCRNFLFKHQSPFLQDMESFSEGAKATLRENDFHNDDFFSKFDDYVKEPNKSQEFPPHILQLIRTFISNNFYMNPQSRDLQRVVQMLRKTILLETEDAHHDPSSRINDSYIYLSPDVFGQIVDIAYVERSKKFIFVMKKFDRIYPKNGDIPYPINQFPFEEPVFLRYHVFHLTDDLIILKGQVGETSYHHYGRKVRIFTVRANEWLRF